MKKTIKIGEKDYFMKASAYTQFAYKNETGRSFLKDIQKLTEITKEGEISLEALDEVNELMLKIAYVMVEEADSKQAANYEEFLKNIDNLYDNQDWITEVILLACSPISRQLQENK